MASTSSVPASPGQPPRPPTASSPSPGLSSPAPQPGAAALVSVSSDPAPAHLPDKYFHLAGLPVELDVRVPVRDFRIKHLLALAPGVLIESQWYHGEDVPLGSADVHLAWTEFEVVETQLAVRVTRLA